MIRKFSAISFHEFYLAALKVPYGSLLSGVKITLQKMTDLIRSLFKPFLRAFEGFLEHFKAFLERSNSLFGALRAFLESFRGILEQG